MGNERAAACPPGTCNCTTAMQPAQLSNCRAAAIHDSTNQQQGQPSRPTTVVVDNHGIVDHDGGVNIDGRATVAAVAACTTKGAQAEMLKSGAMLNGQKQEHQQLWLRRLRLQAKPPSTPPSPSTYRSRHCRRCWRCRPDRPGHPFRSQRYHSSRGREAAQRKGGWGRWARPRAGAWRRGGAWRLPSQRCRCRR